ncbi:MAG: YbjN domain-containing protein [Oscillospiraceae bacterium]|nr:YbjN domain-containing protein [Oscillospiraceae bacterium]
MELTPEHLENAKQNFAVLLSCLEQRKLKYSVETPDGERPHVLIHFTGNDLPMSLHIIFRADRQIVSVLSAMPFRMTEEHRRDAAVAVAYANNGLIDGSFDLNMDTGEIRFRMTSSFMDMTATEAMFAYMIYMSAETIDRYNDRFMMLNTGAMSLDGFIAADRQIEDESVAGRQKAAAAEQETV